MSEGIQKEQECESQDEKRGSNLSSFMCWQSKQPPNLSNLAWSQLFYPEMIWIVPNMKNRKENYFLKWYNSHRRNSKNGTFFLLLFFISKEIEIKKNKILNIK